MRRETLRSGRTVFIPTDGRPKGGKVAGRKLARPAPVFNTTRTVETDEGDRYNGAGSARFCQAFVVVKTGSVSMLKTFNVRAAKLGINVLNVGADDGQGAHDADRAGSAVVTRPEIRSPDGRILQRECAFLIPTDVNRSVRCEFLVWGIPESVDYFLSTNTGEGKPIHHWTLPEPVTVAGAAGSGPDSKAIQKRIRESAPDQLARDARETLLQWAPGAAPDMARGHKPFADNPDRDARSEAERLRTASREERLLNAAREDAERLAVPTDTRRDHLARLRFRRLADKDSPQWESELRDWESLLG